METSANKILAHPFPKHYHLAGNAFHLKYTKPCHRPGRLWHPPCGITRFQLLALGFVQCLSHLSFAAIANGLARHQRTA